MIEAHSIIKEDDDNIVYYAEPTIAEFHADTSFFRGIRGPLGSGKSVGCCTELFGKACSQEPFNGIRRTRWAVIRNTYGELKTTTIKTWNDWFGDITRITYGHPIIGKVFLNLPDNTRLELELYFVSADKEKDIRKLKSLDLTGVWLNEASEIPESILHMSSGRVDRFPPKWQGGASWSGIIADTNSMDIDNYWYRLEVEDPTPSYKMFKQPPALLCTENPATGERLFEPNPKAENIENHTHGFEYYLRQLAGKPIEWVNVFILNQFGSSVPGAKVYGDYDEHNHCTRELDKGLGHIIWTNDFNFTPLSSVIMQRVEGELFAVGEIVLTSAVAEQAAIEFSERYKDFKQCIVYLYGDSSGRAGEKHGHPSDYANIERYLKSQGWRVVNRVPKANGSIKDSQNSLRAKIRDAKGLRSFFVNPHNCKMLNKGLASLKYKEGSTIQEEDADYQHITTAVRYYTAVEFPIEKRFAHFD